MFWEQEYNIITQQEIARKQRECKSLREPLLKKKFGLKLKNLEEVSMGLTDDGCDYYRHLRTGQCYCFDSISNEWSKCTNIP